jgi:geranylgeranyl diphosphate synthase type I
MMMDMFSEIKQKIDRELKYFVQNMDKSYSLRKISPLLFQNMKDFVLRDGKRVRPTLFVISYLGFSKKSAPNLYKSAISIELLHDFMLIHDDIIDKSDTRRGKPSMHKMQNNYLKTYKDIKFNGQDLAIITGDVLYALSIDSFLSIKENMLRKEKGLKKFIESTIYTGTGEFIELILSTKNLSQIKLQDIYKVYDYKTAYYTFASPLSIGAILAGASTSQITKLSQYGLYLGRAFQIKDDILGMFSEESKIGKSSLTDLQEAKKTILIWYAYNNSNAKDKSTIKKIFSKKQINRTDLLTMRKIITASGALDYAKNEVSHLLKDAQNICKLLKMRKKYKSFLSTYPQRLLNL